LLVVHEGGRSWAVPGSAVLAVERRDAWRGAPPLDSGQLLGADQASALASDDLQQVEARVVVVGNERARVPLLACGVLRLLQISSDALLPLPEALRVHAPLVAHVALENDVPSIFVLSPERLLELSRG
jgi:hypothetical protein